MKLSSAIVGFALGAITSLGRAQEGTGPAGGRLTLEGPVIHEFVVAARPPLSGIWIDYEGHNGMGLVIRKVMPGGPAARAGIQPGQIITEVDGTKLATLSSAESLALMHGPAGTPVRIEVLDAKDFSKVAIVPLIRQAWPERKVPVVPRAPKKDFAGPPTRFLGKLQDEPAVAHFSRADAGAGEKIRDTLSNAGIEVHIAEGELPTVRVWPKDEFGAKALLQKVRAEGHWSVTTFSTRDGKVMSDPQ